MNPVEEMATGRQQATLKPDEITGSTPTPLELVGSEPDRAPEWYRIMILIRTFETRAEEQVTLGKIPGGMHSARGQEASAVGVVGAMRPDDVMTGMHRSHPVSLAKGLPGSRVG